MALLTAAELKDALAFHFKVNTLGELPSDNFLDGRATQAVAFTLAQFQTALIKLGYTQAQANDWLATTEGHGYQLKQSLWELLIALANLDADDLWVEKLNVLKEFAPDVLVVDGVIVTPEGTGAGSAVGLMDAVADVEAGTVSPWTGNPAVWNGW